MTSMAIKAATDFRLRQRINGSRANSGLPIQVTSLSGRLYENRGSWLRPGCLVLAAFAAAVKLQPVRLDLVAGSTAELIDHIVDVAGGEVLHRAALRANEVMVMRAPAEPVVQVPIVEHYATDDTFVGQELKRSEDCSAADAPHPRCELLRGEVPTHGSKHADYGHTRSGNPVIMRLEALEN
jgi:hypothetical protein